MPLPVLYLIGSLRAFRYTFIVIYSLEDVSLQFRDSGDTLFLQNRLEGCLLSATWETLNTSQCII
jgi:hypothetical protein